MRLMGKCRMLLQENEELGKMISSGRTARLEGEISLHKALVAEMKKNQKELDEFVGELEEDVEGMQGMIFMLQQQLKEAREQISRLQQENEQLRTLQLPSDLEPGGNVYKNGIGSEAKFGSLLSSSSQLLTSSQKSMDHILPKSFSGSHLVPLSNSSDLALTTGSTDDFSPGPFSVKVTPDSGIQTQDEDEATDLLSNNEFVPSDSSECHANSQLNLEPARTARVQTNSVDDDGVLTDANLTDKLSDGEENLRTSHDEEGIHEPTANSVIKSNSLERTSPFSDHVSNFNGDIQVTANESSESSIVDGVKRTPLNEEVRSNSKDRTEEEKLDLKLTNNSNDNVEDISECLGLKQECPEVTSF